MKAFLTSYSEEVKVQLAGILRYWIQHTPDLINGGFYGRIDNTNKVDETAPKGSVLNARILWTFSAAFNHTGNPDYLRFAQRAYDFLVSHFLDKEKGGVYWTVDYQGNPLETKKQIYALAFAIYGLSEYAKASGNEEATQHAISLYHSIETYAHDTLHGGYIEALTRPWQPIHDLRLSEKDANERKSMNTHLHVLEGYANLYTVWPSPQLKESIRALVQLFTDHIIDKDTYHLVLFFDDDWERRSRIISYGHDIEAAWLVQEAAETIDSAFTEVLQPYSVQMARAALEGIDEDGGLWYEYNLEELHVKKEKHWWPQAEAMVGFFNAWQVSKDDQFLIQSFKSWEFIQNHLLDKRGGEWFWGVSETYALMEGEDKVGLWKCPYHNARACIEVMKRCQKSFELEAERT